MSCIIPARVVSKQSFTVSAAQQGKTLAAVLRLNLPDRSWSEVRQLVESRRVKVGADVCQDAARRLKEGDTLVVLERTETGSRVESGIVVRHLDAHVVVVEKPAGLNTVRHPAEREWTARRRALSPTLEDLIANQIIKQQGRGESKPFSRLRIVHRLDKETSGLVVFARTVVAERGLGKQFHAHSVHRRYLTVVPGYLPSQRIESILARDRGDGRRGSARAGGTGKKAITHVEVVEKLAGYTLLSCRLETGRTHQIRIHLAEAGHPICGDPVYHRLPDGRMLTDSSGAPRLALHASELGFEHPVTGKSLHFAMPLPTDLASFVESLRRAQ